MIDQFGNSLLHLCVVHKRYHQFVHLTTVHKAKCDKYLHVPNAHGFTPLLLAALTRDYKIFELVERVILHAHAACSCCFFVLFPHTACSCCLVSIQKWQLESDWIGFVYSFLAVLSVAQSLCCCCCLSLYAPFSFAALLPLTLFAASHTDARV